MYQAWRGAKLRAYPGHVEDLVVEVHDPYALSAAERGAILERCRVANMAVYRCHAHALERAVPRALGAQLGLHKADHHLCADEDGVAAITVVERVGGGEYIPYTNRPINWHTDGYYNPLGRRICAMALHCIESAPVGGENALLDHEIAYILLRDAAPEQAAALMQHDAMTIPANCEHGMEIRATQTGPVFSVLPNGALHMRYTARTRSIIWQAHTEVLAAAAAIERLLNNASPYIFQLRLEPGEGIICNNVLHKRNGFVDTADRRRLMLRARYYDRIED